MENWKRTMEDWNIARNTVQRGNGAIHTVGPGIWREN